MNKERWAQAVKAASCAASYRRENGFTETKDDYFVDGVQWADEWLIKRVSEIDLSSSGRLHNIWKGMRARCNNPKIPSYKNYGGRGIRVCDNWNIFFNFAIWSILNGYNDILTIDRINNDKGYCPENCRWVDKKVQANNTSRNNFINGKTIAQYAEEANMNYRTIHNRVSRSKMTIEEALSSPPYNPQKVYQYDMEGNFIAEYSSAKEAYKSICGSQNGRHHINDVCKGIRKSTLGYIWSYKKRE